MSAFRKNVTGGAPDLSSAFRAEARRWIRRSTVTDCPNGALIRRAARLFAPLGFTPRILPVREGKRTFHNLLLFKGPAASALWLNTHTDTVPPGPADRWTRTGGDPFQLTERAGRWYGLGVADVKLNLLCQWEALRRLGPLPFQRPLCLAATYGEERGLRGARRLLARWRGPRPALAVVGEPSELVPIARHRGYQVIRVRLPLGPAVGPGGGVVLTVEGRAAHSSTPALGVNALERGLAFVQALSSAGKSPVVVGFSGGTAPNQVPAKAALFLRTEDWPPAGPGVRSVPRGFPRGGRFVPWARAATVLAGVRGVLPRGASLNWGLAATRRTTFEMVIDLRTPSGTDRVDFDRRLAGVFKTAGVRWERLIDDPALDRPPRSPALRLFQRALRQSGLATRWGEKASCTEAGIYSAAGVPALVFGPGVSTGNVHRPNESIAVSDLARAVRFYENLFRLWTQPS